MTSSNLMLVSHPHILIITIIEHTPDLEIGSWNENMSYSLTGHGQILGMFGTTIIRDGIPFLFRKGVAAFCQRIKTESNHQIFTWFGSFFEMLRFFYMTNLLNWWWGEPFWMAVCWALEPPRPAWAPPGLLSPFCPPWQPGPGGLLGAVPRAEETGWRSLVSTRGGANRLRRHGTTTASS